MYERVCIICHGPNGDGQGQMYTSELYPFPPASLVNKKVNELPDGQIFHTITYGYGVMGAHANIVRPDDRWKIVLYIRKELQTQ
jgi:mono/diheme cytochrome c family protein